MTSGRRIASIFRVVLLAMVVLLAGLGHAQAQDPAQMFKDGLAKFDGGQFEEALPLFEGAYEGTQSPNARLYVARCLVKLGRNVEAYDAMQATLALAREKAEADDKYAQTRDAAAAELALLEPNVGKLIVAFDEAYEDAVILVDGNEVPEARQGTPITIEPGDVQVTARAPGKQEYTETVSVAGGGTKAVAIVLDDEEIVPIEDESGPGLGTLRIVGIAVAGLGVAGMVAFAVTGSQASSKFSEVEDACGGTRCTDPAFADDIDSGKQMQTIANVSLGLGLACLAGGAALIVFGGPDDEGGGNDASASVIATPLPGGAFLGLTGQF